MKKNNYAAIDIGSNAARLLIKTVNMDSDKKEFKKQLMLRVPLRLGFDVFTSGKLSDKKAEQLKRLMKAFGQLMKIYEVNKYRACATSAMRDASNGIEIIKKIKKATGIKVEIIDGKEEAFIIYNNHVECIQDRTGNIAYVDVGGGSTEINLLANGHLISSKSYNIGTVRLLNHSVEKDIWSQMENDLRQSIEGLSSIDIIGSGGNINKLYRLASLSDNEKAEKRLSIQSLKLIYEELLPLTPEERMSIYNLKQDRADVIVPAAEVFLKISEITNANFIYVPVIGLSDGIIDELYTEDMNKQK